VGSFNSGTLIPHISGELDLTLSHRARITVEMRGQSFKWIAPFELAEERASIAALGNVRGRLVGFVDDGPITPATRPVRDFRGWLWQDGRCVDGVQKQEKQEDKQESACLKRAFVSVRLPIELFSQAIYQKAPNEIVWPPADLDQIKVHVEVLPPGNTTPLFDSNAAGATPPFSCCYREKSYAYAK
jgi:hypothetical protein